VAVSRTVLHVLWLNLLNLLISHPSSDLCTVKINERIENKPVSSHITASTFHSRLISFTDPFLHSHSYSFRTAFMDFNLYWIKGVLAFYRAMHFSAKRSIAITCHLSVFYGSNKSKMAAAAMLERFEQIQDGGRHHVGKISNDHISATGRPIHFVFGYRVGFSGTADLMALSLIRTNSRWQPLPSWIISNGHIYTTAHDLLI